MKKGFTIVEVSILFVIFIIVAFLVAPLSIDDTVQAKNTSKWRVVQQEFTNIYSSIISEDNATSLPFSANFETIINNDVKETIKPYRIKLMNNTLPESLYTFNDYKSTFSGATIAFKFFEKPIEESIGIVMYDVNGKTGPNVWGKDVFGLNLYKDHFEPFGKSKSIGIQRQDCSKDGSGKFCSNYYLIGGGFD